MRGEREGQCDQTAVMARIVGLAEGLVKALTEGGEESETAGELEARVARLFREAGAAALGALLSARFGRQEGRWRPCECGGRMKFERYAPRKALTVLGPAEVKRAYYRCGACGATYYVGAAELGDAEGGKTIGVQEALSLLAGHLPFEESADKLERLLGIHTCTSEVEKQAEAWGERLEAEWEDEVEAVFDQHAEVLPEAVPERLYVALDGCKTPLTDQWRETRIGAVYDTRGRDEEGVDEAGRTTYVGVVYRPYEEFGRRLYVEALRRGLGGAKEVVVLGDGAPWIWELAAMHFPQATHIVDGYHVSEHLWEVADAVYGRGSPKAKHWVLRQEARLREGRLDAVLQSLRALPVSPEAAEIVRHNLEYFRTNRERLRYDEYRERGLHIGSGVVESACRHVANQRLKRAGMRWTQRGAQATLNLRILDLNRRWDAYWNRQRRVA
jgi:hypothetical protein